MSKIARTIRHAKSACASRLTIATLTVLMGGAAASAGSPAVSGDIEYGYWGNAKRTEVSEAVMKAFHTAFPDANVRGIVAEYRSYIERLTVQAAAGELPCVTQTQSTFLTTYASRNVLMPLDDLVKSGAIDVSGIPAEVLDIGKYDGKLYMVPAGTFVKLIAYNHGLTQKYGIEDPAKKTDFNSFKQWLIDAQKKLPKGVFATEANGANLFTLDSWIAGHGQSISKDGKLGFDKDVIRDYLAFWKDLHDAGTVVPADRLDEQLGAFELRPLSTGQAIAATRDIPNIAQSKEVLEKAGLPADIRFIRNPANQGAKSGNVPGANGLSISTSCNNVPTASAFINFFVNDPKAAVAYRSSNGIVASKSSADALLADKDTPEAVRVSLKVNEEVVADDDLAAASYPSGYQALQDPLRRAYEGVMLNGVSPTDAAERFFKDAGRALR